MPLKGICLKLDKCIKTKTISTMFTLGPYMKVSNTDIFYTHSTTNPMDQEAKLWYGKIQQQGLCICGQSINTKPSGFQVRIPPSQTSCVLWGAGQGHGLRIKGYRRQSTTKLQQYLKEKATVHETNK
ncbi:hypothetical protein BC941DRAFT_447188 [Chlamydoabsidia padenii]|nr:hypothetical protein BC941DRAFT_447188 [Chlamydoabsidia padenii]